MDTPKIEIIDKTETNTNLHPRLYQNNNHDANNLNCDDPWNYKILLLLKKIGTKTMGYRWMHEREAEYYENINTKFGIYEMSIMTILGIITGTEFINFVNESDS